MSWTPLAERFTALPLILSGPLLRRVEPESVTVWLALKEPRIVTLRVYARNDGGGLVQQFEGTRHTIRLGNHLHIVAVTASASAGTLLQWGEMYYYDLFFQTGDHTGDLNTPVPARAAHLDTPGILNIDPAQADPLQRLVYPGHPLPSFVLPAEDINQLRVVHGSCRKPHVEGRFSWLSTGSHLPVTLSPQHARSPQSEEKRSLALENVYMGLQAATPSPGSYHPPRNRREKNHSCTALEDKKRRAGVKRTCSASTQAGAAGSTGNKPA